MPISLYIQYTKYITGHYKYNPSLKSSRNKPEEEDKTWPRKIAYYMSKHTKGRVRKVREFKKHSAKIYVTYIVRFLIFNVLTDDYT